MCGFSGRGGFRDVGGCRLGVLGLWFFGTWRAPSPRGLRCEEFLGRGGGVV